MVLVISEHCIKVALSCWHVVKIRAGKLLVLKVYLAVRSDPWFQQQWVGRESKIRLKICEIQRGAPMLSDFIMRHLRLEALFNHRRTVLQLMKQPFVRMPPAGLGFKWGGTDRVRD